MISAEFFMNSRKCFTGFRISGHSGYGNQGNDIVCASVSSAVQLTANTITDIFLVDADVSAENNIFELKVNKLCNNSDAHRLIKALYIHIGFIAEDYSGFVNAVIMEV